MKKLGENKKKTNILGYKRPSFKKMKEYLQLDHGLNFQDSNLLLSSMNSETLPKLTNKSIDY